MQPGISLGIRARLIFIGLYIPSDPTLFHIVVDLTYLCCFGRTHFIVLTMDLTDSCVEENWFKCDPKMRKFLRCNLCAKLGHHYSECTTSHEKEVKISKVLWGDRSDENESSLCSDMSFSDCDSPDALDDSLMRFKMVFDREKQKTSHVKELKKSLKTVTHERDVLHKELSEVRENFAKEKSDMLLDLESYKRERER